MLHLPHFNYWAPQSVASFLFGAKTLNLRMVTLVEEEMGDVCKGDFLNQFVDTLHHYSAVYDSLETGSPMQSRTRAFWWSSPLPWQWGGRELLLGGVHFSSNPALQISLSLSLSFLSFFDDHHHCGKCVFLPILLYKYLSLLFLSFFDDHHHCVFLIVPSTSLVVTDDVDAGFLWVDLV